MTADRWARVAAIVEEALALPPGSRPAFLADACADDPDLYREAASLLASHDEEEQLREAAVAGVRASAAIPWTHDRFELHDLLGSGGFGHVYKAFDRLQQQWVAIKILQQVEPIRLDRFKQEFRRTTAIRHRNVVRMHELFSDGRQWFFTMELVDGVPLLEYVRGDEGTAELTADVWSRLQQSFAQLIDGLSALHDAGIVHGDVKPHNLLVDADGRVVLLDFGLVRDISHQPTVVAGTPAYMAPEQLSQGPVSQAADWYSVGVLLYEALTGRVPFSGSLWDVLWKKQRDDIRLPALPSVPSALTALCQALLDREPAQRPSAVQIRERLLGYAPEPMGETPDAAPVFVGRTTALAVLREAFQSVGEGSPVALHLHGLSGIGKSTLVRRFLDSIRRQRPDAVVLTGRCYESESVPFKALDELVDGLSRYLSQLSDAEVEALLPRDLSLLARVFPALRRVPRIGGRQRQQADPPGAQDLRDRALAALIELLERLGARRHLVLWIDDLQWGDFDSVRVLRDLQQPAAAPCLLLILSYRLEDLATSPVLQAITDASRPGRLSGRVRELAVGQLSNDDAAALAAVLYGDLPPAHRRDVVREAGGSPLFLHELARHARESGSAGHAPRLLEMIQQRIVRLPSAPRRLLETVAVAGQPLERVIALRASGAGDAGAEAQLAADFLVRASRPAGTGRLDTYHDTVREAVLSLMPEANQRDSHRRLAEAIEAAGQADPERLVHHYRKAGIEEAAYRCALQAASTAEECLAFDQAASLYRLALELRERLGSAGHVDLGGLSAGDLWRRLAVALSNAGRTADAAAAYLHAAERSTGDDSEDLRRLAADQMLRGGQVDEGLALLTATLRERGMRLPRRRSTLLAAVTLTRLYVRVRGTGFREREPARLTQEALRRIDRLWVAGATLTAVDPLLSAYVRGRHLVYALRAGEPSRVAVALALEAVQRGVRGAAAYPAARRILDRAREIAERVERPDVHGSVLSAEATVAFLSGRVGEALRYGLEAQEVLARASGVTWELTAVRSVTLGALGLAGQWHEHARRLRVILRDAEGNGDRYTQCALPLSAGSFVGYLAADDPAGARRELDDRLARWGRSEADIPHWAHLSGTIETLLYERRFEEAWELSGRFRPLLRRTMMVRIEFYRLISELARARCAVALVATRKTRKPIAVAESFVVSARRSRSPLAQGWGLLVDAAVLASGHDGERASARLRLAEERLREAGAAQYAAAARRRRGELTRGQAGAGLVLEADGELRALGASHPARMAHRLVPGFETSA